MIRLVASDVDGTLIPEGNSALHPEFVGVIRKLKEKGILFAAASGRSYISMKSVFEEAKDEIYFIANNGGVICYQGEPLWTQEIDGKASERILTYLRDQKDIYYQATTVSQDYTECDDEEMIRWVREGYKAKLDYVPDITEIEQAFVKISVYYKKLDAMECLQEVKSLFGDEVTVTVSGAHWIDFVAAGAQKGYALSFLQEKLAITREETAAFGDNDNDISMLLAAQESYAVSEARESVKHAAKYVLPDTTMETVLRELKGLL